MRKALALAVLALMSASACRPEATSAPLTGPAISRRPPYHQIPIEKVTSVPPFDPNNRSVWQLDFRSKDLASLDLESKAQDLMHSLFDLETKWPDKLPSAFDPSSILETGKNPGLNVRSLHRSGITGQGVAIAIVDQTLLVDHVEYKDRLIRYEEVGDVPSEVQMHGQAVSSIAVGKSIGTAPDADLYFFAAFPKVTDGRVVDLTNWAKAVERVVEVNGSLPRESKIRVLSLSFGWSPNQPGYDLMIKAVNRAKREGIFVVACTSEPLYSGFSYYGLGRQPTGDPDDLSSYGPVPFFEDEFYTKGTGPGSQTNPEELLVPMDSRTVAGFNGPEDYAFYGLGGYSWCPPYIAGLYALACQVKPDITPTLFIRQAMQTGDTVSLSRDGKAYRFGKIVNPVKLIESLKASK